MMKTESNILKITDRLGRRYAGQYVGVVDGCVVAWGKDQLKVLKKAEKSRKGNKDVGVFYIPSKSAHPFLLKVL